MVLAAPASERNFGLYNNPNFFKSEATAELVRYGDKGPYRRTAEIVSHHPLKYPFEREVWYRKVVPFQIPTPEEPKSGGETVRLNSCRTG